MGALISLFQVDQFDLKNSVLNVEVYRKYEIAKIKGRADIFTILFIGKYVSHSLARAFW